MSGKSFETFTSEFDSLAGAAREAAAELPALGPHLFALEDQLDVVREVKARQRMHEEKRHEATRDLHDELTEAQDLAIQLRSVARAEWGPRDPRLARFG